MEYKILTFHRAINYGAILQCYALNRVVSDLIIKNNFDSKVYTYNYKCLKIDNTHKVLNFKLGKNNLKRNIRVLCVALLKIKKKLLFRKFINKYIKLKSKINDEDVFIVGSDQVWNYKITDFDDVFLLNLNEKNIKKYSYAASFGIEKIEDEYLYKYKELLLDFDFITVREHQAYKILKNQMNIESEIVLDPTLLLDASQWSKIFKKNKTENKYILMYLIIKDDKIIDFALQLSKKTGLKIIFISDHIFERVKGIKYLGFISPEKWAYLFYNAEFVVTNSFHGVAFSINFNKNFFVDLLPKALSDVNSRIIDILKLFSLENRLIDKVTMMDNINYKSINDILKQEKQKSLKYLKKIIGCDESV